MKKIISFIILSIITVLSLNAETKYRPVIGIGTATGNGTVIMNQLDDAKYVLGYSVKTEHGINFINEHNESWFLGLGTAVDYYTNTKGSDEWTKHRNHLIGIPTYITGQYIHNIKKTSFTCKINVGMYSYVCGWDTGTHKSWDGTTEKYSERDYSGECMHYYAGSEIGVRIPIANNGKTGLSVMAHWAGIWYKVFTPSGSGNSRIGINISIDF